MRESVTRSDHGKPRRAAFTPASFATIFHSASVTGVIDRRFPRWSVSMPAGAFSVRISAIDTSRVFSTKVTSTHIQHRVSRVAFASK